MCNRFLAESASTKAPSRGDILWGKGKKFRFLDVAAPASPPTARQNQVPILSDIAPVRWRSLQDDLFPSGRRLPANVPWKASVRQSSQCSMNWLSSFFSFELSYQRVPLRRRLGGVPEAGDQLPPKPLAVPAFIVQNGRALS